MWYPKLIRDDDSALCDCKIAEPSVFTLFSKTVLSWTRREDTRGYRRYYNHHQDVGSGGRPATHNPVSDSTWN